MSLETKKCIRFFTIIDYEMEEQWLHNMYLKGWKFVKFVIPCFYTFVKCEPADMIFKLEFNEIPLETQPEYVAMLKDYGWEYILSGMGWHYYCKPASENMQENELFTDDASKLEMVRKIFLRRFIPITVIFLCCVIPNFVREFGGGYLGMGWSIFWVLMMVLYIWLLTRCTLGLLRLKRKYGK